MRKENKTGAVFIFIGCLLVVIFAVGMVSSRDLDAFQTRYRQDYALDSVLAFCREWFIPAGIIGIPMLLISLILSLWQESKNRDKH